MIGSRAEPIQRLVLDTSAYSHLRAGNSQVLDLVAGADIVLMPVIVLGELEAAFVAGSRAAANRADLAEFLDEPFVSIVDVTRSVARRYGEIHGQLRRGGTPIPVNDIWIAAITLESSGTLLTFDTDFRQVQGLGASILVP